MMRRNGGMAKVLAGVCVFFVGVYLFYLYYDVSGRLKQTERTAERYRREGETASAQLQDMSMAKSELQQRCDSDKQEFTNRLNSLQQQYKMLKSQHEDMENDFSKLQNERETDLEQNKKIEEERNLEYNKFKQEKILEVSSLKDSVANLEREKQELTEEITKLKEQLQNNMKQVTLDKQSISTLEQQLTTKQQETAQDKQTIGSLQQELNKQKQQYIADQNLIMQFQSQLTQAQNLLQQQAQQMQAYQQQAQQQQAQQAQAQAQAQQNQGLQGQGLNLQNLGLQNVHNPQLNLQNQQPNEIGLQKFMGQGNRNMFNMPFGGPKNPQQNSWHPIEQQQQQQQQQQPINKLEEAHPPDQGVKPLVNEGVKLANEVLQKLEDKHKPVDPDVLEQQQQQHQLLPPKDKPEIDNYHNDNQQGHGKVPVVDDKDKEEEEGAGQDAHDGRIENQGPVNLQVQEPNLKPKEEDLKFRPQQLDAADNQLQPNQPVDDSVKQEQMEIPVNPLAPDNNLRHAPAHGWGQQPQPQQGLNEIDKDNREIDDDEQYDDENDKIINAAADDNDEDY